MCPMRSAKRVVDVYVDQRRQLGRELFVVLLFPCVKSKVLLQDDISRFGCCDGVPRCLTDTIGGEFDWSVEQC